MLVRHTTDPFRNLDVLRRQVDGLFGRNLAGALDAADAETMSNWNPAMDVIERDDVIVLVAELPGLTQEDVEITVENNSLSLRGEKKFVEEENKDAYRRIERRYGSFYRSFSLPTTVDQENIDANFSNGVLEIRLPKAEKAKPKKIAVKVN